MGGCRFDSRPGLLCTKVYSAFHPSMVGKWVPAVAGNAKAGMALSDCDERVGVQVKLWDPLRTYAIPERFWGDDWLRRGAISSVCTFTFTFTVVRLQYSLIFTLRARLQYTAAQCIVIGPVCGFVTAGGRCPNLTTASTRSVCVSLSAFFFSFFNCNILSCLRLHRAEALSDAFVWRLSDVCCVHRA